jgi:transposase
LIAHLPIDDLSGVASIDPGVRTFATVYDTDGNMTEWGAGATKKIVALSHYSYYLGMKARNGTTKARTRRRLRRLRLKTNQKIRNLVNDIHCRLAKHLCETYQVVLLPTFRVSKVCCELRRECGI